MAFETGPYLQMALFCDRVIEEKDGVLTVVRVIDRVIQTATGAGSPADMPPFPYSLTMVVTLKSGQAKGRHEITITQESPSGIRQEMGRPMSFLLEGDERGQNLVIRADMTFEAEGLYWFDVNLDGTLITRVPLRVLYVRR